MAKTELNVKGILKGAARNNVLKRNMTLVAQDILEENKQILLDEYNNHPVTQEIEQGLANNKSRFLKGVQGSLFAFIGFENGSNPAQQGRDIIKNDIRISPRVILREKANGLEFSAPVIIPTDSQIENKSPLPWEPTKSWIIGIEKGISGLSNFLARIGDGRSGGGVQIKNELRSTVFKTTPYFKTMLQKFIRRLERR